MKQGGGCIINSTSSSIKQDFDDLILSNTFRMGVAGMNKTMAHEFDQVVCVDGAITTAYQGIPFCAAEINKRGHLLNFEVTPKS